MHSARGQEFKRRIELTIEEHRALVEELRDESAAHSKRSSQRYDFTQRDIPLTVVHPDGFVSNFLVYGRNLSSDGASFLHGGYVHPGTRCRIVLPRVRGGGATVEGTIRHCRLIRDSCHEIGMQFQQSIDIRDILGVDGADNDQASAEAAGHIAIAGRILLTGPKGPQRDLMQQRLEEHGLVVRTAASAGSALDDVRRNACDLVLHGLSLQEENGLYAIRELRKVGYSGPIVMLLPDRRLETMQAVVDAGADEVLLQPVSHETITAIVISFIGPADPPSSIVSTARDQMEVRPFLGSYLEFTNRAAERLDLMTGEDNLDALREVSLYLKTSAIDFGFVHIAAAAFRIERILSKDEIDRSALSAAITFLAGCCRVAVAEQGRAETSKAA